MGNSQSVKPLVTSIITYEEALSRITAEEYEHLQTSYEDLLGLPDQTSFVSKAFLGFPEKFSAQVYKVFAPYDNLSLEKLLVGLVIMIRGTRSEKLQLLFYSMSSDGNKVSQEDMASSLVSWGIEIPKNLDFLFTVSEACSFEHFLKWIEKFSPNLGVYDWVLDNEGYGFICQGVRAFQTYHQFLAEQASFTEKQVTALEKHYNKLRMLFSRSKRFDLDAMYQCLHPLYTFEFSQRFFHAFDLNKDGTIDCRELVIGLSAILEGEDSFAKFVFDMFDENGTGVLLPDEVENFTRMISTFCLVTDSLKLDTDHTLPEGSIPVSEFIHWCNNSLSMYKFLSHLKNIVYIVFGVKPDLTFNIIRQWMEMEANMNLITGKMYYIANNEWFKGSGGFVNNSPILAPGQVNGHKTVPSITREGGTLRTGLLQGVDYQIISQVLWCTLEDWYGCDTAICRRARLTPTGTVILELFPLKLNFYKQPRPTHMAQEALNAPSIPLNLQSSIEFNAVSDIPRHVLSYTGVFYTDDTLSSIIDFLSTKLKLGREDLRLWKILPNHKVILLDETEDKTLDSLGVQHFNNILIEVRNTDMSWPEEVVNIVTQNRVIDRRAPTARVNGTTGLNNLGNTCFMNSSIQCLSNTRALTVYFLKELHQKELNQNNPDSLNGLLALRYGTLIKNLWSCSSRTIAPLKMRWTVGKFAPQFSGFGQHDAQELLDFLLDGLHEDLNRITTKPYTPMKDSNNRSDLEVSVEFWNNHVARNRSIIVDLFHGQLKSTLRCCTCGFTSVTFDPFSFLSLPLPENENVIIEVFVVRLDPDNKTTQYCLWLNNEYTLNHVRKRLIAKIPAIKHLLFVDVENSVVKRIIGIDQPLHNINFPLYAFELPGEGPKPDDYVVVYSRHYVTIDKYFFDWQHRQVNLFGTPFIIPTMASQDVSQSVTIRERIRNYLIKMYGFDDDFIDNMMYNININKVKQGGRDCCICQWRELCYGHKLLDDPDLGDCGYLTVDWSSAVVHLIRQYDDDVTILQDSSVKEAKLRQSQSVDLSLCLKGFTKEEEIAEWYCTRCSSHKTAIKKLDIWKLPPFLIIHLKRFSFQGGKWVKCKRTVSFQDSFDPSPFLVQSSQISLSDRMRTESVTHNTVLVEGDGGDDYDEVSIASMDDDEVMNSNNRNPFESSKDSSSYITNSMKSNTTSKKANDIRPFYDLYAVTSHTGQIGGGHYMAFALNPNRQWYYYNDSQVKKTTKKRVLSEPAYILFYERKNLRLDDLLPSYGDLDQYDDTHFDYDASIIMKDVLENADRTDKRNFCSLQ